MATIYIARDTTLGDTFESNYTDSTDAGSETLWTRQMTVATASEVESTATLPNSAHRILVYHVEVGKLAWGTGDYITRLRVGATGDTNVDLDRVHCRRVSQDGNTVRASISSAAALNQTLAADTNRNNTISDSGGTLDQPSGAAATDHLVLIFELNNNSPHGGDETPTIEQNLSASTQVSAPFTLQSRAQVSWAEFEVPPVPAAMDQDIEVADTFTGAHTILVGKELILGQAVSFSDSPLIDTERILGQSATFSDSTPITGRDILVTQSFSGSHALTLGKDLLVSAAFAGAHALVMGKDILRTQAVAFSDTFLVGKELILAEAFSGAEDVIKSAAVSIAETFTGAHNILINKDNIVTESFAGAITILAGKGLIIGQAFSGAIQTLVDKGLILAESFTGADEALAGRQIDIAEAFSGAHNILINKDNIITDTLSGAVSVLAGKGLILAESFSGAVTALAHKGLIIPDTLNHVILVIQETLGLGDQDILVTDTMSGSHSLLINKNLIVPVTSSFSHTILAGKGLILGVASSFSDAVVVGQGLNILVTDTFSGAHSIVATTLDNLGKATTRLSPQSFRATLLKLKGKVRLTDDG